jgi:hypothetical protein
LLSIVGGRFREEKEVSDTVYSGSGFNWPPVYLKRAIIAALLIAGLKRKEKAPIGLERQG